MTGEQLKVIQPEILLKRDVVLTTAGTLISGERDKTYGDATESFAKIGKVWGAILDTEITAAQVAMLMAGLKIVRLSSTPGHDDSWIDLAGYAALGAEAASKA